MNLGELTVRMSCGSRTILRNIPALPNFYAIFDSWKLVLIIDIFGHIVYVQDPITESGAEESAHYFFMAISRKKRKKRGSLVRVSPSQFNIDRTRIHSSYLKNPSVDQRSSSYPL